MVKLTRIYTRTGDDGTTALGDMSRTVKTDSRLAAYADVNEANATVGVALALGGFSEDIKAVLLRIQNDLFDVGADLATPVAQRPEPGPPTPEGAAKGTPEPAKAEYAPLRVEQSYIDKLEADCDRFLKSLEKLRSFILPGGSPGAALLHHACTVVRRAERSTWAALEQHSDTMNPLTATYLNRLSDLIFILARTANKEVGDVLWKPGENR